MIEHTPSGRTPSISLDSPRGTIRWGVTITPRPTWGLGRPMLRDFGTQVRGTGTVDPVVIVLYVQHGPGGHAYNCGW